MYKAIIADDEIHICMLLQKLVDWENMGVEIIGWYMDGEATLEAIRTSLPDIVITDIRMPKITGLDIVKTCNAENIKCIFLLLSGHAEFEYAHMALKYNVENYLLKPVNKEELENNLRQIITRLDNEKKSRKDQIQAENKLRMNKEILGQQFLNNVLRIPGWMKNQDLNQVINDYSLEFGKQELFRVIAVKCISKGEFSDSQYQRLLKQVVNYSEKAFRKLFSNIIITDIDSKIYFLIHYENKINLQGMVQTFFEELKMRFFEYCDVSAGISRELTSISQLSERVRQEVDMAVQYRLNGGLNKLFFYEKLPACREKLPVDHFISELATYVELVQPQKVEALFAQLFGQISGGNLDLDSLFELEKRIKEEFIRCMQKLYQGEFGAEQIENELNIIVENARNKKGMLLKTQQIICRELMKFSETQLVQQTRYVALAKEYITAHLQENISLNDVSGVVYMNPTYFSTLFKKTTGQNFSDYLVEVRIEHAKELLKDLSLSVAEVGFRVGYQNSRYFSKVFLKTVGVKPSEYRKLCIS